MMEASPYLALSLEELLGHLEHKRRLLQVTSVTPALTSRREGGREKDQFKSQPPADKLLLVVE